MITIPFSTSIVFWTEPLTVRLHLRSGRRQLLPTRVMRDTGTHRVLNADVTESCEINRAEVIDGQGQRIRDIDLLQHLLMSGSTIVVHIHYGEPTVFGRAGETLLEDCSL
jgi:hypothetical protein